MSKQVRVVEDKGASNFFALIKAVDFVEYSDSGMRNLMRKGFNLVP
jgi:hypothetical protein